MVNFYGDLGVDPQTDLVTFMISSKMKAANMGVFTIAEFKEGFN